MAALTVPVLSIVIGEGGSGGALAMAVANEVWMLEKCHLFYSFSGGICVHPVEGQQEGPGCSQGYEDYGSRSYERGLIEQVIPEPEPASIETMPELAEHMRQSMTAFFERYSGKTKEAIRESRYQRFRNM